MYISFNVFKQELVLMKFVLSNRNKRFLIGNNVIIKLYISYMIILDYCIVLMYIDIYLNK